jgi:hypothetical protein
MAIKYTLFFQRWAWAFRKDELTYIINTNNGVERQNQAFKCQYLRRKKNSTLTDMVTIMVEDFLPDKFRK